MITGNSGKEESSLELIANILRQAAAAAATSAVLPAVNGIARNPSAR